MISQHVGSTLSALLPSFITDLAWPDRRTRWKVHPTSYLDGLRGIASFVVFICHYTEQNHFYFTPSYGLNPEPERSSLIQLPFLRLVYSGRPMVHIFFIISGFALSYRPLQAVLSRDVDKCFTTVSSSAFRRPIRLFGPCVVSTFLIAAMVQLKWLYQPLPTVSEQMRDWFQVVLRGITWPWAWDDDLRPRYDVHLWTIPIEFVHSMLLFMVIIALCRLRPVIRQSTVFGLLLYFLWSGKWAAFEFVGGMLLAEFHLRKQKNRKSLEGFEEPPEKQGRVARSIRCLLHVCIFSAAAFIGGWPNWQGENTPGIRYLLQHTPHPFSPERDFLAPQKFWFALSAIAVVWSCGDLPVVRRVLEGSVPQYLGRTSYAFYIVHGPVLDLFQLSVLGSAATPAQGELGSEGYRPEILGQGLRGMIGIDGPNQRMVCWLAGLLVLTPMVVWVADIFWRLVDLPIIGAAKKLETACLDNSHEYERVPNGYGLV